MHPATALSQLNRFGGAAEGVSLCFFSGFWRGENRGTPLQMRVGGDEGIRTPDPLRAKQVLSH